MSGPYINNGNYKYGVSQYTQPCPPGYDTIFHHKLRNLRDYPENAIRDDGVPYNTYLSDTDNSCCCCNSNGFGRLVRSAKVSNVVNIETTMSRVMKLVIYGTSSEYDQIFNMEIGRKYTISYITERGLQTVTGTLKEFSTNIPEECTRYIGVYTNVVASAYIGLDCSTEGKADKRLIYIASIRCIEEVFDSDDDRYSSKTQSEKIKEMVSTLSTTITALNSYIAYKIEEDTGVDINDDTSTDTTSSDSDSESDKGKKPKKRREFDPWRGPILFGPVPLQHPPIHWPGGFKPGKPDKNNTNGSSSSDSSETEDVDMDYDAIMEALTNVKDLMNSFIAAYEIDQTTNRIISQSCGCASDDAESFPGDIGVPYVPEVPYNAREKDVYLVPTDDPINNEQPSDEDDDTNQSTDDSNTSQSSDNGCNCNCGSTDSERDIYIVEYDENGNPIDHGDLNI